jgi:tetratricopeptide (TPR) repeat protein
VKPEAYDLVLQGMSLIKSGGSPDVFQRAIALFEKAVALDPQSVEAHAGLANALGTLTGWGFAPYWDSYPRIRKEVDTAMALDPTYSWVHLAKGDLLWAERDPRAALAAYRYAFELDPGNSTALWAYGFNLDIFEPGPEGESLIRKAIDMDPLAQAPRCALMTKLYAQRRYEEAKAQALKILDLDPNWFWAWDQLWRIHVRQGKLAEAQEESRKAWAVVFGDAFKPPPNPSWDAYERWVDRFLEGAPRTWVPGFLAANYARRGEKQKALDYLETAAKGNDVFMGQLDWPDFDPIREDPRFQKIVQDRKLPVGEFCRIPPAEGKRLLSADMRGGPTRSPDYLDASP